MDGVQGNNQTVYQFTFDIQRKKNEVTKIDSDLKTNAAETAAEERRKEWLENARATIENKENPLNKMYGGIKEFRITQSMCMSMGTDGMGMGSMADSDMQLTGQELLDISSLLSEAEQSGDKSTSEGKKGYSPEELAEKLKEKGYDASTGTVTNAKGTDSGAVIIKREDGTEIKIADANGDGALNTSDYDFSAALDLFYQDLEKYNKDIGEIDEQINITDENIEDLDDEHDDLVDDKDEKEDEIDELEKNQDELLNMTFYDVAKSTSLEDYKKAVESKKAEFISKLEQAKTPEKVKDLCDKFNFALDQGSSLTCLKIRESIIKSNKEESEQAIKECGALCSETMAWVDEQRKIYPKKTGAK